jgi:hypothetical protein
MSKIYVEKRGTGFVAIQDKKVIAQGDTQEATASAAHRLRPDDPILGERQRFTKVGSPDKWRRLY